jgi:hypothetical protein
VTRQTSIESYNKIREGGLLGNLQFAVYEALYLYGPLTEGEVWARHLGHSERPNVTPRFAELERLGVLRVVDKRPCGLTGRLCMVWDVTDRLPIELAPEPKPVTLRDIVSELQTQVKALQAQVGQLENKFYEPTGQGILFGGKH